MLDTSKPTAELQRRHAVQAPQVDGAARRPFWFKLSRVAQMHHQGKLTDQLYSVACYWRSDFELVATLTMPQPALDRIPGGGSGNFCPPSLILDAQRRLRQAGAIIPSAWGRLLIDVLVDDLSWRSLEKIWGRSTATLQNNLVTLLVAVEPVYANYREPV